MFPGNLTANRSDELMRDIKDEDCSLGDGAREVWVRVNVRREGDVGKIFNVFVEVVDEGGEFCGFFEVGGSGGVERVRRWELIGFFVYPHLNFGFKEVRMRECILANDLSDRGAPGDHSGVSIWFCGGGQDRGVVPAALRSCGGGSGPTAQRPSRLRWSPRDGARGEQSTYQFPDPITVTLCFLV